MLTFTLMILVEQWELESDFSGLIGEKIGREKGGEQEKMEGQEDEEEAERNKRDQGKSF